MYIVARSQASSRCQGRHVYFRFRRQNGRAWAPDPNGTSLRVLARVSTSPMRRRGGSALVSARFRSPSVCINLNGVPSKIFQLLFSLPIPPLLLAHPRPSPVPPRPPSSDAQHAWSRHSLARVLFQFSQVGARLSRFWVRDVRISRLFRCRNALARTTARRVFRASRGLCGAQCMHAREVRFGSVGPRLRQGPAIGILGIPRARSGGCTADFQGPAMTHRNSRLCDL